MGFCKPKRSGDVSRASKAVVARASSTTTKKDSVPHKDKKGSHPSAAAAIGKTRRHGNMTESAQPAVSEVAHIPAHAHSPPWDTRQCSCPWCKPYVLLSSQSMMPNTAAIAPAAAATTTTTTTTEQSDDVFMPDSEMNRASISSMIGDEVYCGTDDDEKRGGGQRVQQRMPRRAMRAASIVMMPAHEILAKHGPDTNGKDTAAGQLPSQNERSAALIRASTGEGLIPEKEVTADEALAAATVSVVPAAMAVKAPEAKLDENLPPFPMLGVKLDAFDFFIKNHCNGLRANSSLTTTQVCDEFLKPVTVHDAISYCEWLENQGHDDLVGTANVFVSHAWKYRFADVVLSIRNYMEECGREDEAIVWFDLFSNNQHGTWKMPFEWWTGTFRNAIHSIGHTVMVLQPWKDPVPLTRAWCLFEVYASAGDKTDFDVAMSVDQRTAFLKAFEKNSNAVNDMLGTIDLRRSQAFSPNDKEKIFMAVTSTVGFENVNRMVFEKIRKWVVTVVMAEVAAKPDNLALSLAAGGFLDKIGDMGGAQEVLLEAIERATKQLGETAHMTLQLKSTRGRILCNQMKFDEAEAIFSRIYPHYMKYFEMPNDFRGISGIQDMARMYEARSAWPSAVKEWRRMIEKLGAAKNQELVEEEVDFALTHLATDLKRMGNHSEAMQVFEKLYEKRRKALGDSHKLTIGILVNMSGLFAERGELDRAEKMLRDALASLREKYGDHNPDVLRTMINLGTFVLQSKKDYAEGERLHREALDIHRVNYGTEDLNSLYLRNGLAHALMSQRRFTEAEDAFREALQLKRQILGAAHSSTLTTLHNLSVCLKHSGKLDEAARMYRQGLDTATRALGQEHALTVGFLGNLGALLFSEQRYEEAIPLMEETYEARKRIYGVDHPRTMTAKENLDLCRFQMKR